MGRSRDIQVAQFAIAVAKQEVEQVLPGTVLLMLDEDSPWGRALLKVLSQLDNVPPAEIHDIRLDTDRPSG